MFLHVRHAFCFHMQEGKKVKKPFCVLFACLFRFSVTSRVSHQCSPLTCQNFLPFSSIGNYKFNKYTINHNQSLFKSLFDHYVKCDVPTASTTQNSRCPAVVDQSFGESS